MESQKDYPKKDHQHFPLSPFFELSHDLLCIAGFDGYFKKISPSVSKTLGYSENELFSRPINSFVHPADKEETNQHRNSLRAGKPLLNYENRYISKSGKTIWLSWTSMPLNDEELVYAIAKNITHKKESELKRNKLLAELNKTNSQLKQLTYTTSHDLRSPVFNLLSVFSLLDKSTIQDEETLEFIDILETATHNLKGKLDSYLDKLKGNEILSTKVEELSLSEIYHSVVDSLDSFIQDSNAVIKTDFTDLESIPFNGGYMESIFMNMITNSIKYAYPGRNPVINIFSKIENGKKQLVFSDNGRGFDTDQLEGNIFRLNQTFHDHKDGKGVGLYLVYNHVRSLGGNITVESEIDMGSTFTIIFADKQ